MKPLNTLQPPDWLAAFRAAAKAAGVSLGEWIGEAGKARLSATARKGLSERTRPGGTGANQHTTRP